MTEQKRRRPTTPHLDEERLSHEWLAQFEPWFRAASEWLDANPERLAALEAWEAEYVDGSGAYGTHQWPGWADSPVGPWPW
jgi:hypothetical protein